MALTHSPKIVRDGLVLHLDFKNPKCYSGSGSSMTDLSGNNTTATLNDTYSYSSTNDVATDGITFSSNGHIQLSSITNITTVSLWYMVLSTNSNRYLLDARTGGSGGWIYNDSVGSNWSNGTIYNNGNSGQILNSTTGNAAVSGVGYWRNVTVIASTPMTDDMNLFSRNSDNEGLNARFTIALVYNRVITEKENRQNFEAYRDRHGI